MGSRAPRRGGAGAAARSAGFRPRPAPTLGARAFAAPYGEGWGTVRPAAIFNGGDPSGSVTDIHWRSWGGPTAIGWGRNPIFRPGGGYFAHPVAAELKAGALGHCGSRRAYTRLSIRVPKRPGGPLGPWRLWSGAATICKSPSRPYESRPCRRPGTPGAELHYERAGAGEPLLAIQGMSGTRLSWGRPFLERLQRDFDVVVFDNRGIGDSARVTDPFTIADLATDAEAVLDAVGCRAPMSSASRWAGWLPRSWPWPRRRGCGR